MKLEPYGGQTAKIRFQFQIYLYSAGKRLQISICHYHWFSQCIVDFELSSTLDKSFILTCLKRALNHRQPEIITATIISSSAL